MLINTVQTLSVFCCLGAALALLPQLYAGVLFAWHPLLMVVGFLGEFGCHAVAARAQRWPRAPPAVLPPAACARGARPPDAPARRHALAQAL